MKKNETIKFCFAVLALVTTLSFLNISSSHATTYYPSSAGGNWNAGAAWSTSSCGGTNCLCSPALSSDVVNLSCAKTITVTATVSSGAVTISGGTLIVNAGVTLTLTSLTMTSGTLTVNGTLNVTSGGTGVFSVTGGTLTAPGTATGTIGLSGGAQTLTCTQSFYNLNIAGSGDKTMATNVTVYHQLQLTTNHLLVGAHTLTIGTGLNGIGVTQTSGTITTTSSSTLSFGGGSYSYTLGTLLSNTWPVTLTSFVMTSNLATISLGTSQSLTVSGAFDLSAGGNFKIASNVLTLNGAVNMSGTCFCNQITGSSTSDITLGGSGAASIYFDLSNTNAGGSNTIRNLNISVARNLTMLSNLRVGGTLTMVSGATLSIAASTSSQTLTIDGSLASATAGTFIGSSTYATMIINGSGSLGANLTFSSVLSLAGFQLDRISSGTVVLGSNLAVSGNVVMTSGTLDINNKTLDLGTTGAVTSETSINYIWCSSCTTTTGKITSTATALAASTAYTNVRGLGLDITTGTTAPGSTAINRGFAARSGGALTSSILRWYEITPTTNSGLNATMNVKYWTSELNSITESTLQLFNTAIGTNTWVQQGGTDNTGTHAISLAGIASFAAWTAGGGTGCTAPTIAVNLPTTGICNGGAGASLIASCSANCTGIAYTWAPSAGLNVTTGTTVTATPSSTQTYTVTATITGGCTAMATSLVTVNSPPSNPSGLTNQVICGTGNVTFTVTDPGAGYTVEWSTNGSSNNDGTGAGGSGNLTRTKAVTVGSPITEYALISNNSTGCLSAYVSATGTANANPSPIFTAAPSPACINTPGYIYNTQGGESGYVWTISGGTITTGGNGNNTATVTWTATGTESITVNYTDGNGCTAASATSQSVTVNGLPTVTVSPTTSNPCSTDITPITASGALTYTWSPSTQLDATTGTTVNASPTTSTTYTVTGTDGNGCAGSATSAFTVRAAPVVIVTPSEAICTGTTSATLVASGASVYTWSPATFLNTTTGTTVTAQISVLTFYTVMGTGSNGCTANSAPVPVATIPAGGNVLPAASVICSGTTTTLTETGAAGHDYQWQISTDNVNWTNISGATNTSYTTLGSDGTTLKYYRIVAQSNACYNVTSNSAVVAISATPAVTLTSVTSTTATITWAPFGSGQYNISWSGTAGTGSATGVTSNVYEITSLLPNSSLLITVTPSSPTCAGVMASSVSTTTLCAVPGGVMVTAVAAPSHNLQVSWNAVPGATTYRVYYRDLVNSSSWSFADVTGTSTILSIPYGGDTYAVYVAAKNCPATGDFGDASAVSYITTNTISACSPIPTVSASSGCPNQITIGITGGSGSYAVSLREISPNLTAGASYNVSGSSLNISVGTQYAGSVWEIYARNVCSPGVYSALSNIAIVTVKPGCPELNNLVLSHVTCHGFTASWNADNCGGLGITSYQLLIQQSGSLNYNGYTYASSAVDAVVNWLNQNYAYNVEIRSIACNGATSATTAPQTVTLPGCREEMQAEGLPLNSTGNDNEAVAVYPNPTDGHFFVDIARLDMSEADVKIELINQLGQVIETSISEISGGHLNQMVVAPAGMAAGVYFVRTTVGGNVYVSKIVVSNE